jgi:hypothetical protein
MPVDCFDKINVAGLKDKFQSLLKPGMTDEEQRAIGTKVALDYHKQLHDELEGFKKSINPKYKPTDYISPDKSESVKAINDQYAQKLLEPPEKKTGIKNAISNPIRFERALPKVDIPKLGSDNEVLRQGKELVDSGKINPREVVQRINSTNEGMHPDEAKAMQYYMHQLGAHETQLQSDLADAGTPTEKAQVNSHIQQLSDEIDAATEANLKSGAAWAHVGNIRQIVTDAGFNPSRERAIIKDAYGGTIPEHAQKIIDSAIKERDEAIAERLKAEERLKNTAAEKTLQKVKEVVEKEEKKTGKQKKEQIREERKSILDELKSAIKKDTSSGYAFPFPTHTIPVIGKLAISYFKEGYVNLDELVSKVFDDIKAHFPNATKKDVRDAISQYDPLRDYARESSTEKLQNKEARIEKKLASGDILDKKTTPSLNFEKDSEWRPVKKH